MGESVPDSFKPQTGSAAAENRRDDINILLSEAPRSSEPLLVALDQSLQYNKYWNYWSVCIQTTVLGSVGAVVLLDNRKSAIMNTFVFYPGDLI